MQPQLLFFLVFTFVVIKGERISFTWTKLQQNALVPTSPTPRFLHSAFLLGNGSSLEILSGFNNGTITGDWWSLSLNSNGTNWSFRNSLSLFSRYDHSSVSLWSSKWNEEIVLLFGGQNSTQVLNDAWAYYSNDWHSLTNLPSPNSGHSATLVDNDIYIFGGFDGTAASSMLWVYSTNNDTWSSVGNGGITPIPRFHHNAINRNNSIIIFGGQDGTLYFNDVWSFDTSSLKWSQIQDGTGNAPSPRFSAGAALIAGGMLVFGGRNSTNQALDEFYFFLFDVDPTLSWNQLVAPEPPPRFGHSITSDSQNLNAYMFGGSATNGFTFNDVWRLSASITPDLTTIPAVTQNQVDLIYDRVLPDLTALLMLVVFVGGIVGLAYWYKKQGN